jgi:hypothetical protein
MKILAFSDLHSNIVHLKRLEATAKKEKPDYIFNLGDFTIFEQNVEEVLERLNNIGLPMIVIHGNHETDVIVQKICKRYPNLIYAHRKVMPLNGFTLVCHGGGGFYYGDKKLLGDKDFDRFVQENKDKLAGKLILLTHAPPAHTKIDHLSWVGHAGCTSYEAFIKKYQPVLSLAGHLHENFCKKQKIGKTLVANPGPAGTIFTV